MILRELFHSDNEPGNLSGDPFYDGNNDRLMPMKRKDTRKVRLSLKQINRLRLASERHILEQEKELEFIEQMYKTPTPPPTL